MGNCTCACQAPPSRINRWVICSQLLLFQSTYAIGIADHLFLVMGMLKLGSSYPGWPCYAIELDCCWWEANNKLLSILLYTFGTTCKQMCPCLSLYGSFMLIPIQKLWIEVNNALSGFGSWFLSLFQVKGRSNLFIFLKKDHNHQHLYAFECKALCWVVPIAG